MNLALIKNEIQHHSPKNRNIVRGLPPNMSSRMIGNSKVTKAAKSHTVPTMKGICFGAIISGKYSQITGARVSPSTPMKTLKPKTIIWLAIYPQTPSLRNPKPITIFAKHITIHPNCKIVFLPNRWSKITAKQVHNALSACISEGTDLSKTLVFSLAMKEPA